MYNFPLVEYIYWYYRYDLNIPTADRRGIGWMCDTQYNLFDIPVANLQSFGSCDSTAHKLCCTDDQSFHDAYPPNDSVWFWIDEPLKRDVGDLWLANLVTILLLKHGLQMRCVALLWELQLENQGVYLPSSGLLRVSNKVFRWNQADLVVVTIKCEWAAAHLICIPGTRYCYVYITIGLVIFNRFWPKPPEAEGDMQTVNDTARPEENRRNWIASVDKDKEDEEEEEEDDEEDDNAQ